VDEHRSPEEMRQARSILGLFLNSVSQARNIFQPVAVDRDNSIFRFHLSDVGWSQRDWDRITSFYPYCLRSDQRQHRDLYNRLNTEAPFVRGDWFFATVSKAPLYNELLGLDTKSIDQIARDDLGVDINQDIADSRIQRVAFRSSGVSKSNRLFERHRTQDGGYLWVSYDFDSIVGDADLRQNPLGPRNRDNHNFRHSFQNLAGEMIWSLPNGMQAYLLALADGTQIEKAVTTVVTDPRRFDDAVQNGISCFGCHGATGMNQPRVYNEIQAFVASHSQDFDREEIDEVRKVYPNNMQQIVLADAGRYLGKARTLVGDILPSGGAVEYDDWITAYGEYEAKVGLHAGAIELQTDLLNVSREVKNRSDNEGLLPLLLSDPLVTRDDWTCRFRTIIRDVRRANFCNGTFNADEVANFCDNRL
jgi:hypothetical protein